MIVREELIDYITNNYPCVVNALTDLFVTIVHDIAIKAKE